MAKQGDILFYRQEGATALPQNLAYGEPAVDKAGHLYIGSATGSITAQALASKRYTATLLASAWSASAPYTQTVSVSGMVADGTPLVDKAAFTEALQEEFNKINGGISTAVNSLTAKCLTDKPTSDIPLRIEVFY
ncbi:MAG: hypothetical protein RSC01_05380 [Oscillospiraceae bacterium]